MSLVNRRVIYPSISQLPEMYISKGSINILKNINAENLLLLVSNTISKSEVYTKIKEKTLASKIVKEEIITKPDQETVLKISKKYGSWPPDAVVAIGGGVVLDSAKLIRHFLSFPEETFDSLSKQFVSSNPGVKLVSVPSTPNTGSESNNIAVSINSEGLKIPFVNKSFIPNLAILDPVLLKTIPEKLMYDFVADIITHAYEGSISRLSNSYLQNLAFHSIEDLQNAMESYKNDERNDEVLEKILLSGHSAGIVAGNSFVGMIHALGHSLETLTGKSHGFSLHSIFKQCLDWQLKNLPDKKEIIDFYQQKFVSLGLTETADIKLVKNIDKTEWANLAINDPSIKTDPIKFTNEKLLEVISWIQNNY